MVARKVIMTYLSKYARHRIGVLVKEGRTIEEIVLLTGFPLEKIRKAVLGVKSRVK